jgi:hypothetical protein
MLIRAKYEDDKINALHAEPMGDLISYTRELAKDQSNGFTKDRTMRLVGRYNNTTLLEYDRCHPGWMARIMDSKDVSGRNKAWREFLNSDYGRPTMTVEALKK